MTTKTHYGTTTVKHLATDRDFEVLIVESYDALKREALRPCDMGFNNISGRISDEGSKTAGIALARIKRDLRDNGHGYRDADTLFGIYRSSVGCKSGARWFAVVRV